jgi:hypothetical protein
MTPTRPPPVGGAAAATTDTTEVAELDPLVYSSTKAQKQEMDAHVDNAAPALPTQDVGTAIAPTETTEADGQRVSAFPYRGRADSGLDDSLAAEIEPPNQKQSVGSWVTGGGTTTQSNPGFHASTPVRQLAGPQPGGMAKGGKPNRRKKTLPHRPSSFAAKGKLGSGMEPELGREPPRQRKESTVSTASTEVAESHDAIATPSGGGARRKKKTVPPPPIPQQATGQQPLVHMSCVELPMSSPLASMASLGGKPTATAAPTARRSTLWRRGKKAQITKDMIGLPNEFKHVSHTAPQDVGPLLSALRIADFGSSSI